MVVCSALQRRYRPNYGIIVKNPTYAMGDKKTEFLTDYHHQITTCAAAYGSDSRRVSVTLEFDLILDPCR